EPLEALESVGQVRIGLVDRLCQHVQRTFDGVDAPSRRALRHVEERIVDLVRSGGLAKRQNPVGLQQIGTARLDLDVLAAEDRVGAERSTAVLPDLRAGARETDEN